MKYFGHTQPCQTTPTPWINLMILYMPTLININLIITTILEIFLIYHFWTTLGIPNHARPYPPDIYESIQFLSMCKKSTSYIKSILRYWTFKNLATWLVETIWGFNTKTRILSDVGFAMGGQELQQFSFPTISRKIKWQNFGALSAQTWAKIISLPVSF